MQRTLLLLVIGALFSPHYLAAQNRSISEDSLHFLLKKVNEHYYNYDYSKAIEMAAVILDEAEKTNNHYFTFRGYNELGQIHNAVDDTVRGRMYYEKSLEAAIKSETDSLIAWAYNDLGNIYAEDLSSYQKSIHFYEKAIQINKQSGQDDYKNLVEYMNIGWTYLDIKKPNEALPYLKKVENLAKLKPQHELLSLNLKILYGRYYFYAEKEEALMIQLLNEAAQTAAEKNYMAQASEAHDYLTKAYERQSDFALMANHLRKKQDFDERIHTIEKEFAVTEASAKFDLEKYQKDLETATMEKAYSEELVAKSQQLTTIFVIASIILFIAGVAFFLLFRARKNYIGTLRIKNEELTEAKNRAEKLSNLKTQFFSTVSHELRTPLYGVIGISSILLEDKKLSSHKDDLKSLKFSADYLLALINDVLMLNKMDANGLQLERTPFKLSQLLKDINRSFAFSLEQNNNQIHLDLDPAVPNHLMGDSVRLSQILMNLVGNAVKFNENGTIWITTKLQRVTADGLYQTLFSIKDDGIGIPKEKQATIFEEFSQVENKNYNYQGTGLGLPIVKKLLNLFDSEISLESEIGQGANFTFVINLEANIVPVEKIEMSNSTEEVLSENVFESVHVLVVDDNRINQKITQKILESRNFNCSLADDGASAITMAKTHNFDLILMDIHMPGIGGLEATETIRMFDKTTPIIALTAVEIDEIRKKIVDSGMNDIILKPYDVSQFLNVILRNLVTAFAQ